MLSTRAVIAALRRANPHSKITEHRLRNAIRREAVPTPRNFQGRYAWTPEEVVAAAMALGLQPPAKTSLADEVTS